MDWGARLAAVRITYVLGYVETVRIAQVVKIIRDFKLDRVVRTTLVVRNIEIVRAPTNG